MIVSPIHIRQQLQDYPQRLFHVLLESAEKRGLDLYISGGALRDWLLGSSSNDLDFTISYGALEFLEQVKEDYGEGTIVPLGVRHDDTCRLVLGPLSVDVSGFRQGSATIYEDLAKRDFTVNALSADFRDVLEQENEIDIIDPMNGLGDMQDKMIRACPGAFSDDPLRMLRAFRFAALLGFEIDPGTLQEIGAKANLIDLSAAERISYELDQVMMSSRAFPAISGMDSVGLTEWILPELYAGHDVSQPSFHHLDVLQHNLFTLDCLERIIAEPGEFFPDNFREITEYLREGNTMAVVKWAALFHDVGKPATKEILPEKEDRITFYGHDEEGARIFETFAERLKWSRANRKQVGRLIAMHMHPFHLCNILLGSSHLSDRSQLKICRKAGEDLPGLFLLAMADCMAGQGEDKVDGLEENLADLFNRLETLNREKVIPVLSGPKLLTGHDLIDILGIAPGPEFKRILAALDLAVIEGAVSDRTGAFEWVKRFMIENS